MKKHLQVAITCLCAIPLINGCGNWNVNTSSKVGTSGITANNGESFNNDTGDMVRQEVDEDGNMRDCTIGNSSKRYGLPSCNDIVNRRESEGENLKAISDGLINDKLRGSKLFTLPNGGQLRVNTNTRYNDETHQLIITANIMKSDSMNSKVFENLFISSGAKIEIAFIDSDDGEMLTPITLPLNVEKGQALNINYRKKLGATTSDVVGVRITARKPIQSIREYKLLNRLEVGFRPN